MLAAASAHTDPWRFQAHLEVWLLVAGLAAAYTYAAKVIGPRAVPAGRRPVTGGQWAWFVTGLALLWLASDWPVHDISEEYLYSVHMVQHMVFTYAVPAAMLLATPRWLADLVIGRGRARAVVEWVTKPVVAGFSFTLVLFVTHIPGVVNSSVENGLLHYAVHTLVVVASLAMWSPICGPFTELRLSLPGQMLYLFAMSMGPVVPAGWLTFAEGTVYKAYDYLPRFGGISVTSDQQAAGLIMKLGGSAFVWTVIVVLFVRWVNRNQGDLSYRRQGRASTAEIVGHDESPLTAADVNEAFRRSPAAPEPERPLPSGS